MKIGTQKNTIKLKISSLKRSSEAINLSPDQPTRERGTRIPGTRDWSGVVPLDPHTVSQVPSHYLLTPCKSDMTKIKSKRTRCSDHPRVCERDWVMGKNIPQMLTSVQLVSLVSLTKCEAPW